MLVATFNYLQLRTKHLEYFHSKKKIVNFPFSLELWTLKLMALILDDIPFLKIYFIFKLLCSISILSVYKKYYYHHYCLKTLSGILQMFK